jgi:arylsulfatase
MLAAIALVLAVAQVNAADTPSWVLPAIRAPRVQQRTFDSAAAKTKVSFFIYTPKVYDTEKERRFPVMYWLHGTGGGLGGVPELAARFDSAIEAGKTPPMLVVFANGLATSMWCDSKDGSVPMETVVVKELVPHVDAAFRTIASREGRLVEGFSMGGYGAARLGFKHPDVFGAVSVLAGGPLDLEFKGPRAGAKPEERERILQTVYGGDMEHFKAQSPWVLAERNAAVLRDRSRVRMATGARDFTLELNRRFSEHLKKLDIPNTFTVPPGVGHSASALLDALGEENWRFYRAVFGEERRQARGQPPNVVIIFCDDLGYGDVGCYGAKDCATPHIDRMAAEGVRLTDFYAAAPSCTPSRAALLTGCYPQRVGLPAVVGPRSKIGISADETTLAELLKARGYATACIGKWHLGDAPQFLPTRHGFDEYFGLPYSNDMWPHHPETKPGKGGYPSLPLIEGETVVKKGLTADDQAQLTTWYAERAVKFIEKNKGRPFFLYLAHSMPHVPLFVSEKFRGKSRRGLYGDVVMEIDGSVGQILDALKAGGFDDRTLVVFTSDNGPWLRFGEHGGSAGPLREGKGTCWEGGMREPFVARWPGRIPAGGVCREPAMTIDLLPTIAKLAGAKLPARKIDGLDIWPLLAGGRNAQSPHEAFYFYEMDQLQAVRSGRWKLQLPHTYRTLAGRPGGRDGKPVNYEMRKIERPEIYELDKDVGETTNVADKHPDVVERLASLAEKARRELGDSLTSRAGKGVREPGRVAAGR